MKKTKKILQLPNNWDLSEMFMNHNTNLKYCLTYKCFYYYTNNMWISLTKDLIYKKIIKFLKSQFPECYKKFNIKNLDDIILLIMQNDEFSMQESKISVNKKGFLLPFKNGILNTKTLEFFKHDSKYFVTHIIPIDYDSEATLVNTKFSEFLSSIVNYNLERLHVLRACLNLMFTNNLSYQIALYIYGPGGTGKSTLINILTFLLGSDACLSTSLTQLNSRFGLSSLIGKILLILNDVSFYRGTEPKTLKEIITQDRLQGEQKYQPMVSFNPNAFVILTSNILWELKNSTTGISRRMIYFPFENIPEFKDFGLFKIEPDGEAWGTLVPFFSGFINWILTCPQDILDNNSFALGGQDITEKISQDLISVQPLSVWVNEWLEPNKDKSVKIGNNKSDNTTLFGNYVNWTQINGVTPLKFNQFSTLLLDLMKQKGWTVFKKRISTGTLIFGLSIKSNTNIQIDSSEQYFNINKLDDKEFSNN